MDEINDPVLGALLADARAVLEKSKGGHLTGHQIGILIVGRQGWRSGAMDEDFLATYASSLNAQLRESTGITDPKGLWLSLSQTVFDSLEGLYNAEASDGDVRRATAGMLAGASVRLDTIRPWWRDELADMRRKSEAPYVLVMDLGQSVYLNLIGIGRIRWLH